MADETGEKTQPRNEPKGIKFEPDPGDPNIKVGTFVSTLYATSDGAIFQNRQDAIEYNDALRG